MVVAPPRSASILKSQAASSPSPDVPVTSSVSTYARLYIIEDKRVSECALVLFARDELLADEYIVIKILSKYKDTRYDLSTIDRRQCCQLEALLRNRTFSPEVYIGLAPVIDLNLEYGYVNIGAVIEHPTEDLLEPGKEYALLMRRLPEDRRLDYLLDEKNTASLRSYIRVLTEHIAYLHNHLSSPEFSNEEGMQWGSYKQLYNKLQHNLELLDLVSTSGKFDEHGNAGCSSENLKWLKKTLLQIFRHDHYRHYFEQRMRNGRIGLCHGDLKSLNIWIVPDCDSYNDTPAQHVKILDAIDFNPAYCIIDILSDFAMLAIDAEIRTQSTSLANEMIDYYLTLTGQDDDISRQVLGYYLVEKAIVGAAVSIVYDDLPQLGQSFLKVATTRLQTLQAMQPTSIQIP
jgi:aminoglycoside phosphotransferase family enzyme